MKNIRLVAFDMDGTLTRETSAWQYVVNMTNVVDVGLDGERLYRSGKISYKAWGDMVINAWTTQGLRVEDIERIVDKIEFIKLSL